MKILFTADMHIKLRQKNVPVVWQTNRYLKLFEEIERVATKEGVDLIINGGDVFDSMPSLEELDLYYTYIAGTKTDTIVYSGNHEATKKGKTFFELLQSVTHRINSKVKVQLGNYSSKDFDIIPYETLKKKLPEPNSRLLFTHVRGEIPPHVKPEIDLELLAPWKLVLAGDLHSHTNCQKNIVYPGSPVTTSFHRNKVDTGLIVIDTDTLDWEFIKIDMPQLLKKSITVDEEIVPSTFHHTIYEVEGTVQELSRLDKDSELLSKTITTRESLSKLNLAGMTKVEELDKYLREVEKIEDTKEYLGGYNDYIQETNL